MNQQTQPSPREHHFYVAIAKFLFHHPEHGVVSVQDPIKVKDAERYGLSPHTLWIDRCRVAHSVDDLYPGRSAQSLPGCFLDAWRNARACVADRTF